MGSSRTAMNCSPILLFSLFTLSIMRITIFDPVGMVQPVVAAFEAAGRTARSVPGNSRGSGALAELAELLDGASRDGAGEGAAAVFSSPKWICWTERRS